MTYTLQNFHVVHSECKHINPLLVQFKSLLPGQEGCLFFQWAFKFNTFQTGDENLRFLRYNCERRMTQNCLLTHAWFLRT
jgi:hypothetical protein